MLTPLLLCLLALMGCGLLAFVLSEIGRQPYARVVSLAILGYLTGGTTIWLIAPAEWTLSFPQTLAASVDDKTYGHPVEHYAETLLLIMLVASVFGSAGFSAIAAFGGRLVRRHRLPAH
jgi:hypothetical protein